MNTNVFDTLSHFEGNFNTSLGFHSIGITEYPFSDGKDHTIYIMEKEL